MTRMYSVFGQRVAFVVFRDPRQAKRWLDDEFPHHV
jgi:hypothetical protein